MKRESTFTTLELGQLVPYRSARMTASVPSRHDRIAVTQLARDIKRQGITSPLTVRLCGSMYQVVCGELRWAAAIEAGYTAVPVEICDLTDAEADVLRLVDNMLTP